MASNTTQLTSLEWPVLGRLSACSMRDLTKFMEAPAMWSVAGAGRISRTSLPSTKGGASIGNNYQEDSISPPDKNAHYPTQWWCFFQETNAPLNKLGEVLVQQAGEALLPAKAAPVIFHDGR